MNTNAIHNIINILLAVVGALGAFDWGVIGLEPQTTAAVLGGLGFLKLVMNTIRDGLGGLWKVQPPVK